MRTCILLFLALAASLFAQPTVAPTNAPVGPPRGEEIDGYNITNSFELGYRFRNVNGDLGKYRSDVNFGNGVRLLGSSFTMHSKEGQGGIFDELLLNTQGLGNDPYQFSNLRIQKNRLYRYDLLWRENEYFNPALTVANGQHLLDTQRRLQDHNITLLPQSAIRLFGGYSRNTQSGSGLSTLQLFDARGDEFPLFADVRRSQDEYRLGFELNALGARLSVLRGWEYFKDDTRNPGVASTPGNNPLDQTTLRNFRRDEPYHGSTKNWRIHLLHDRSKWATFSGRFTYAEGRRAFIFDELAGGTDRLGSARTRQVLVNGDARRPVSAGNFTIVLYPGKRLTLTNHTSFHNTRMEGNGVYTEVNNATRGFDTIYFDLLGIRTISNQTDVNFNASGRAGFYGGYHFSARRIRSVEQETFDNLADRFSFEQNNNLHTGLMGIRVRPVKPLTVMLEAEVGRADRPFYPISEKNYHVLGGRLQYRSRNFSMTALARTNYNTNSSSLTYHSLRSRTYGIDGSWTPQTWIGFDAGYQKLHLNTLTGLAYFFNGSLTGGPYAYVSNIHSVNFGARFTVKRVDFFMGYTRVQDTGDGTSPGRQTLTSRERPEFFARQYPMVFDSPQARASVRLHTKLRFNAGYQFYHFSEEYLLLLPLARNYGAHTGFTSLTWSF